MQSIRTVSAVDSHTEGMPTRVITGGIGPIPGDTMAARRHYFINHLDHVRQWLMHEPRGHAAMSGAILQPATRPDADWGVLFIEVSGCLTMCGHGTIGVATVLVETGMVPVVEPVTTIRLDTPAGLVTARVQVRDGRTEAVSVINVPAFVAQLDARVNVPDIGPLTVDVAFGGNFYAMLPVHKLGLTLDQGSGDALIGVGLKVLRAVDAQVAPTHPLDPRIRGCKHVVAYDSGTNGADAKSATLIHPGWIDRSPCGTGTSARLAQLHARGELRIDEDFVHESFIGSRFIGRIVGETTGRFHAGDHPANHRPSLDHRAQPNHARRQRPIPRRIRGVEAADDKQLLGPDMRALIIGAGIIGCALARELASRGVSVDVIDRDSPGTATTAHCEGNVLLSEKAPGPELALAQLSRGLWPSVVEAIREDCGPLAADLIEWEPKGGIVVATTVEGASSLTAFARAQNDAGVRNHRLSAEEAHAAEPYLTSDLTAAYHYPDDAQVQPVGAAHALLRHARYFGAKVHAGVAVTGPVLKSGVLVGAHTTSGALQADAVINCAGPWSADVSQVLGAPIAVTPRRGDIMVTTPQPPTVLHKVYDADYVGAVGSGAATLQTSAVVESTKAGPLLIGSSRRRVPLQTGIDYDSLQQMARKAIRLFPRLADVQIMRAYGGFRPYVDDHLPIIGPDPRKSGLWHVTGHEGSGIALCIGTAKLLGALLLEGEPPLPPDAFRVDRPAVLGRTAQAAS